MATTKSKKASKKPSTKPKAAETKSTKTVKAEAAPVQKTETISTTKKEGIFKGFFARKSDPNENILTIFKSHRIWGALVGELIGTMFLTMLFLTLGIYQPLYIFIGATAIAMVVYALSGAHLNPAVTAGMMATRRVSAIRGVLYIVMQIVGAWLGLLIINAFRLAGGEKADLTTMSPLTTDTLWPCLFIELIGALVIGFFFNRAQHYRTPKGAFTYAVMIAGGLTLAVLFAIIISGNFLSLTNNFTLNPAVAIMYQIFPTSAENFGALLGDAALAALTYIIAPMIGAILGFFAADAASRLAEEEK